MIPSSSSILADPLAYFNAFVLWLAIIVFAVLAGADFGAGIWTLLTFGRRKNREQEALEGAIGPIWEANEIWSVFLVTGLFTAFPNVFFTLSVALFYPLAMALLGFVFRGASFEYTRFFRKLVNLPASFESFARIFGAVSLLTPFILGAAAAAVSSGRIRYIAGHVVANYWTSWTTPFCLSAGLFAVGICSVLAATYMTVQNKRKHEHDLLLLFRTRALVAGAFTALIGAVTAYFASKEAPYLWHNLTTRALPFGLAAVLVGLLTAAALLVGYFTVARTLVGLEVTLILGAWGISMFPYLIVPDLTIQNSASPPSVQLAVTVSFIVGNAIILPSFVFLIHVFQGTARQPATTADEWALHTEEESLLNWRAMLGLERIKPTHPRVLTKKAKEAVKTDAKERVEHATNGPRRELGQTSTKLPAPLVGVVAVALVAWPALSDWLQRRGIRRRLRARGETNGTRGGERRVARLVLDVPDGSDGTL